MYRRLAQIPRTLGIASSRWRLTDPKIRRRLFAALIASYISAPVGALLRVPTPALGKLQELLLQHMPAGFDRRHLLDESTDLRCELAIACFTRVLQLGRVIEISLPDRVLT
jgi:hypothetical protein